MGRSRRQTFRTRHAIGLLQMHRLCEGSVTSRVPRGEAYPLFARSIERNAVPMRAEGRERSGRDNLAPCFFSVTPYQLHEFTGPRPIHADDKGALCTGALNGV